MWNAVALEITTDINGIVSTTKGSAFASSGITIGHSDDEVRGKVLREMTTAYPNAKIKIDVHAMSDEVRNELHRFFNGEAKL